MSSVAIAVLVFVKIVKLISCTNSHKREGTGVIITNQFTSYKTQKVGEVVWHVREQYLLVNIGTVPMII